MTSSKQEVSGYIDYNLSMQAETVWVVVCLFTVYFTLMMSFLA